MKYLNEQLVDSENDKILTIEDYDFSKAGYKKIVHDFFTSLGFKPAKGSGSCQYRNDRIYFSIKVSAVDFLRFSLYKNSFNGYYQLSNNCPFVSGQHKTTSLVNSKGKTYFLNSITFDGNAVIEYVKTHHEQKKEKKQNKTISKFRKDIIIPWVTGNIQEAFPDFEKCSFGQGNVIYGNYSKKNLSFTFSSVRMTQKQISEIDFDDIVFELNINIKNSANSNWNKELKLKMNGMKNIFMNFNDVEKEFRKREVELSKLIRPDQDILNQHYAQKKEIEKKIDDKKSEIWKMKQTKKQEFEQYLNELIIT